MDSSSLSSSSATAKQKWERLNNITTTLDLNSLDDVSGQDDPVNLKRVVMSDVARLKRVKHTSSNNCKSMEELLKEVRKGRKEMGGLFKGKVCGDAIVVMDAFVLPLDHHLDFHSNSLDYFETQLQIGGLEDVVGWYRTSTIGGYPTETDLSTQVRIQKLKDLSFALVIDAGTTIDILKVRVQAFRTYPEGYAHMNRKRNRPEMILEVFPHLEKKNKILCHVLVKREFTKQYNSPTEAVEGLYSKLVKDVGSSESGSKISSIQKSVFFVPLTQDQATKLADHECVEAIRVVPWDYYRIINDGHPYVY